MTDQQTNGSGAAPAGTAPAPSLSGGTDFPALLAQYEAQLQAARTEAGDWKKRYDGQQLAMQKKAEALTAAEQREAALQAEFEGFKGTASAQLSDWQKKYADIEKVAVERETKLKDYDLRDNTRSLISKDFAALLPDFDNDPVMQAGVLALAKAGDQDALKAALTASQTAKQNGTSAAVAATLRGSTPSAPAGGAPATETIEALQKQIRELNPTRDREKYQVLMGKLAEAMDKQP